jgi:hypothetical protein
MGGCGPLCLSACITATRITRTRAWRQPVAGPFMGLQDRAHNGTRYETAICSLSGEPSGSPHPGLPPVLHPLWVSYSVLLTVTLHHIHPHPPPSFRRNPAPRRDRDHVTPPGIVFGRSTFCHRCARISTQKPSPPLGNRITANAVNTRHSPVLGHPTYTKCGALFLARCVRIVGDIPVRAGTTRTRFMHVPARERSLPLTLRPTRASPLPKWGILPMHCNFPVPILVPRTSSAIFLTNRKR